MFQNDPDAMDVIIIQTEDGGFEIDLDPRHLVWACNHDYSDWIRDVVDHIRESVPDRYLTEANAGDTVARLKPGVLFRIDPKYSASQDGEVDQAR